MACLHPIEAWRDRGGAVTFKAGQGVGFSFAVACGSCQGCRVDRSRSWAARCMHEASQHRDNSFITLTYDQAHVPEGHTLVKEHFQLFMKRLRKDLGDTLIRYYHCGEYGPARGRPHYHALIFGWSFPDKVLWQEARSNKVYRSAQLERLWGKGFCTIGEVTYQSAAYVARYCMKKYSGASAKRIYQITDSETGEVFDRIAEYHTMSLRPGIGADWFYRYQDDVFPDDFVVMQGKKLSTPRFYDKLYERWNGEEALAATKLKRIKKARADAGNRTPERLAVREKVLAAKLKLLKRELE